MARSTFVLYLSCFMAGAGTSSASVAYASCGGSPFWELERRDSDTASDDPWPAHLRFSEDELSDDEFRRFSVWRAS